VRGFGLNSTGSGQRTMGGSFEHDNEISVSIKIWEFG